MSTDVHYFAKMPKITVDHTAQNDFMSAAYVDIGDGSDNVIIRVNSYKDLLAIAKEITTQAKAKMKKMAGDARKKK